VNKTIIAWATHTCNVVHGCSKPAAVPRHVLDVAESVSGPIDPKWLKDGTSPECIRCYAENLSNRRGWTPKPWTERNAEDNVQLHPERFREFRKLPLGDISLPPSQRTRVFVCSMGDWGHRLVPDSFRRDMLKAMADTPHIYMCLTKRPDVAAAMEVDWPENVWLGTTCGHPATKWRLEFLRRSRAKTRFVSMEPMLASMLPLNLDGLHQVIVGGESGSGFRPMRMEWVREVRDVCADKGVAFFMKQAANFQTERGCYVVEKDGTCRQYRQFPGELSPPVIVQPDNPAKHRELFPVLG